MRIYFYLVFISQIQARSGIVGNSDSAVHTQQVLQSTFNALINIEYSINVDIDSYQSPFKCALSKKKEFTVDTGIYMLPNNVKLTIGDSAEYNNKILKTDRGQCSSFCWNQVHI